MRPCAGTWAVPVRGTPTPVVARNSAAVAAIARSPVASLPWPKSGIDHNWWITLSVVIAGHNVRSRWTEAGSPGWQGPCYLWRRWGARHTRALHPSGSGHREESRP